MRFSLLVAAAMMLPGPALAQTPGPATPDELSALDKECQAGKVQACAEASIRRGPSGPERPGSGKEGAREAEEERKAARRANDPASGTNTTPRPSGEGGGMPAPPATRR